jgi:RNA polymerase sigma factor (TIGR02999 family)
METHQITLLLKDWSAGNKSALDELMRLVYGDLRRLAHKRMASERENHTLQTTALVHEAYMRLFDSNEATWNDRTHFFAVCARVMRNILVDMARRDHARKRGGDLKFVELDEGMAESVGRTVDLVALDDALSALSAFDTRKSQVMEMRIFGGLSARETAEVLQISTDTVTRDMHLATAWLRHELRGEDRA